jgi:hypothetical protein
MLNTDILYIRSNHLFLHPQTILQVIHSAFKSVFPPMPSHVHIDFVVPPPGCSRSVTDVLGWSAHRAQLRCPDNVSVYIYERAVQGGALNLNSTGYPDHGRYGDLVLH